MSDILLDEQSAPSSPAAGQMVLYPDSSTSLPAGKDDAGRGFGMSGGYNGTPATANQLLGTSDTYVTGSGIIVPSFGLQVGSIYICEMSVVKTAAGTAAPVWNIRLGTAGTTADASQWAHTGVAQTAAIETGHYRLLATVRSIGGAGVLQGSLTCMRTGGTAATGLASVPVAQVTGAAADKAWASGQRLGLSINAGASSAWTVGTCFARFLP